MEIALYYAVTCPLATRSNGGTQPYIASLVAAKLNLDQIGICWTVHASELLTTLSSTVFAALGSADT